MDDIESIIQSMIDAGEPEEKIREAVRLYKEREAGTTVDPVVEPSTVLLDRLEAGDYDYELGEAPVTP